MLEFTELELRYMSAEAAVAVAILLYECTIEVVVVTNDDRREWKTDNSKEFVDLWKAAKRRRERFDARLVAEAARRRLPFGKSAKRRAELAGVPTL